MFKLIAYSIGIILTIFLFIIVNTKIQVSMILAGFIGLAMVLNDNHKVYKKCVEGNGKVEQHQIKRFFYQNSCVLDDKVYKDNIGIKEPSFFWKLLIAILIFLLPFIAVFLLAEFGIIK